MLSMRSIYFVNLETLDQFATRLRQLVSTCEFASVDKEIKTQIIFSCSSSRLRRRALPEPSITLKGLLDLGRAMELSETQASGIASQYTRKTNPADYLSRHLLAITDPSTTSDQAEEYIAFLANHTTPKAITTNEVKQHVKIPCYKPLLLPFVTTRGPPSLQRLVT